MSNLYDTDVTIFDDSEPREYEIYPGEFKNNKKPKCDPHRILREMFKKFGNFKFDDDKIPF